MSDSLFNRAAVRRFILAKVDQHRSGDPHITRVSKQAMDLLESELRARIILEVRRHPSIGCTFRMPLL